MSELTNESETKAPSPDQQIMHMIMGKFVSRSITVAAELGIADLLADGPRSASDLAEASSTNSDSLYRVLRALAAVGVFLEGPGRRFENNDLSHYLRSDVEGSAWAMARWINDPFGWTMWGRLDFSVETGKPAAQEVFQTSDLFGYIEQHPSSFARFQDAMTGFSAFTGAAVVATYDFSGIGKIVDVGGGHGSLLSQIVAQNPHVHGVLFDRLEVIKQADSTLEKMGQASKIETVSGDFFEGVPAGADAYIMKHIIHDWEDDKCVRILTHCRQNMNEGGKILVIDQVVSNLPESTFAKLLDLEMLLIGGRERTEAEFAALFAKAGLRLSRIIPTPSPVAVVEAVMAV